MENFQPAKDNIAPVDEDTVLTFGLDADAPPPDVTETYVDRLETVLNAIPDESNPFAIGADQSSDVAPLLKEAAGTPVGEKPRPMDKRRFASGLLLAAGGMALMLIVALGALQNAGASGQLSLPAVAVCMVIGLMLLGGGFGIMATAAATFDDREFDRLMQVGTTPHPQTTNKASQQDLVKSDPIETEQVETAA